jgi:hypothetical protein
MCKLLGYRNRAKNNGLLERAVFKERLAPPTKQTTQNPQQSVAG